MIIRHTRSVHFFAFFRSFTPFDRRDNDKMGVNVLIVIATFPGEQIQMA